MRILFVLICFSLFYSNRIYSQNQFPVTKNSNLLIDGGGIDLRIPSTNGGWARGLGFFTPDGATRLFSAGLYGSKEIPTRFYLSFDEANFWNGTPGVSILPNGNIGIGVITPQEKLSVNGNIRAKEIKVEVTNWPDYVFSNTYDKISISDLAKYIETHQHLPGVPNSFEAEKYGIELGKLSSIFLKKIEELTLYIIELDKENKSLREVVDKLRSQEVGEN